jgi:Cytochrome c oxidase subunit IV
VKSESYLFAVLAAFLLIVTPIYWFLSQDPAGTTALALSFGLSFLIAFYLLFTARRMDPRPEDLKDGEIEDATGIYGFFSPHSWWPLAVASAGFLVFMGLVFGWWLFIIGAVWLTVAVVGLVFEYYRGDYAH